MHIDIRVERNRSLTRRVGATAAPPTDSGSAIVVHHGHELLDELLAIDGAEKPREVLEVRLAERGGARARGEALGDVRELAARTQGVERGTARVV